MFLFEELREENLDIRNWPERLGVSRVLALAWPQTSEQLQNSHLVAESDHMEAHQAKTRGADHSWDP